jgi:hypothetical protein
MYSIILVVVLNWAGQSDTSMTTNMVGSYNDLSVCQKLADKLTRKDAFPTEWNNTSITKYTSAKCVQVKDKP